MLTTPEIKKLSQPSAIRTWIATVLDWGAIAFLFWLAAHFHNPIVSIFCFILMARQQLALGIMMHDAAHRRLFKSSVLNDYVGQILFSSPVFFSLFGYRKLHLKHHRVPMTKEDPDLSLTGGYPVSRKSLARKLLRDLTGISYFKFIKYFYNKTMKSAEPKNENVIKESLPPSQKSLMNLKEILFWDFAVNGLIFGTLYLSGHPWLYVTLWYLPMITALQVLLRIRGITEHAGYEPNEDQRFNTRTVLPSWQTFLFAPHKVNYHIEHHIYTGIPFFNLPRTHKILKERNVLPEKNLFKNYKEVLRDIVKA